jgi:hypothetical protein
MKIILFMGLTLSMSLAIFLQVGLVKAQQASWCDGSMAPMGDPMVNQALCGITGQIQSLAVQKDTTYDFPGTQEGMNELCQSHATNAGINPVDYCMGMSIECNTVMLTMEECYAMHFVEPEAITTQEQQAVLESAAGKWEAAGKAWEQGSAMLDAQPPIFD